MIADAEKGAIVYMTVVMQTNLPCCSWPVFHLKNALVPRLIIITTHALQLSDSSDKGLSSWMVGRGTRVLNNLYVEHVLWRNLRKSSHISDLAHGQNL